MELEAKDLTGQSGWWDKGRKGSQTPLVTRNCKQMPSTGLQKDFYVEFKIR